MKRFLNRVTAILLCLVLSCSLLPVTGLAASHPFQDVPSSHWANSAVAYVYDNNLMNGTGSNTFTPNGTLTRAMFVTILGRMDGVNTASYPGTSFSDVPTGQWYSPYVAWASSQGIVTGTGNGQFSPNSPVTREQMAAMIARYVEASGIHLPDADNPASSFKDAASVSSWARDGLELMRRTGILSGYADGTFGPKKTATRAEAATIFMRLCSRLDGETPEVPLVNCVGMSVNQVSSLYGNDFTYVPEWFLGNLKGIIYQDLRVPAIFYFEDDFYIGTSNGSDRIVAIEVLENAPSTCAVTNQVSSKTTYTQIKKLGLSGVFEEGPNGEVNSGFGESAVFWHQDSSGNTYKFAWCDGANPNTTNAWITIFSPECGIGPFQSKM